LLATLPLADFPLAAESLLPTISLAGTGKNFTAGAGTLTVTTSGARGTGSALLADAALGAFTLAGGTQPTTTVVLVGTSKNLTVGIGTLTVALAVPLSGRGTNFAKGTGTLTTVVIPVGPILGFIGEYGEDSPE
jgi:hypothetical protein